jgi:hypothetical protein
MFRLLLLGFCMMSVMSADLSIASAAELSCSKNGTVVIYTNGVLTTREQALRTLDHLRGLGLNQSIDEKGKVEYTLGYNTNVSGLNDFLEASVQAIAQYLGADNQYANFSLILAGLLDVPAPLVTALRGAFNNLATTTPLIGDTSILAKMYADNVMSANGGKKVLAISHSQGGFLVNAAFQLANSDGFKADLFSAVEIATPASFIASRGLHLTYEEDAILNVPGALTWNVPRLNVLPPAPGASLSERLLHAVNEVYLAIDRPQYLPIRFRVVAAIQEAAKLLGPNCGEVGCLDANGNPQQGTFHINPDGSIGGFVASTALAEANVTISADSEVCDQAKVVGGSHILFGSRVEASAVVSEVSVVSQGALIGGSAVIYGDTLVSHGATINGLAVVHASTIAGNVLISDSVNVQGGLITIFSEDFRDPSRPGPVVRENAGIFENSTIMGNVMIYGSATITNGWISARDGYRIRIFDNARIIGTSGNSNENVFVSANHPSLPGSIDIFGNAILETSTTAGIGWTAVTGFHSISGSTRALNCNLVIGTYMGGLHTPGSPSCQ